KCRNFPFRHALPEFDQDLRVTISGLGSGNSSSKGKTGAEQEDSECRSGFHGYRCMTSVDKGRPLHHKGTLLSMRKTTCVRFSNISSPDEAGLQISDRDMNFQ